MSTWIGERTSTPAEASPVSCASSQEEQWPSKLQSIVAQSTCEAEYIALAAATNEAVWLREFIQELGFEIEPPLVKVDNQSAIALGSQLATNSTTKHKAIKFHVVRDRVRVGDIRLQYIASADNAADIMTKALGRAAFEKHAEEVTAE